MAFICPSKEQCDKRKEMLSDLKHMVEKMAEEEGQVPCHMVPPPCPYANVLEQPKQPFKAPDMMVCYKIKKPQAKGATDTAAKKETPKSGAKVKQSKSRELRAGLLYVGCDCEKRNGLQDDCQRSECHGSPECLTKPAPTCGPSEFSNGKHLGKKEYSISASKGNGNEKPGTTITEEYHCYPAFLDAKDVCPAGLCCSD